MATSEKRPTPEEWRCLNQFASCLSRSIMEGIFFPTQSPVEPIQNRNSENQPQKAFHRTMLSMVEEAADRLERDIMLEALVSARLQLTRTQANFQTSSLSCYATELASKIMRQSIASARRRMQNIQQIADSLLLPLVLLTSTDTQLLKHNMPQVGVEMATEEERPECDEFLRRFADQMTSRCLSEALRNSSTTSLL